MSEQANKSNAPARQPRAGRNFDTGMTGGTGYVVDNSESLLQNCNSDSVEPQQPEDSGMLSGCMESLSDT